MYCYYCNFILTYADITSTQNAVRKGKMASGPTDEFLKFCPKCYKQLPSCGVCLLPIHVANPVDTNPGARNYKPNKDARPGEGYNKSYKYKITLDKYYFSLTKNE